MIRYADAGDFMALVLLERDCFPAAERWNGSSWGEEVARAGHLAFVHCGADGAVDAAAAFSVSDDFADVLRVVVAPAARRQGIGAQLLGLGLAWAKREGADRAMLEVRADNQPAVALYRKFGFEDLSLRRDYYGPGADALVLIRSLREGDGDE